MYLVVFLFAFLLLLLLAELVLRHRKETAPPPDAGDVLRLREETRALSWSGLGHSVRVVAFGDSIPYGWGVPYEESYPVLLERMLAASLPGREIRVINAGIPGNTIVLGWQRLERDVLRWKPHVVLVGFGLNDVNLARSVFDQRRESALLRRLKPMGRLKAALRRSLLWSTIVDALKGRRGGAGTSPDADEVPKEPLPRTSRLAFELALRDITERIRRRQGRVVLLTMTPITQSLMAQIGGGGKLSALMKEYNAVIRREAERGGSLLVDLYTRMSSREDVESLIGWDGVHLNARGQETVAQIIHQALRDSGVVDRA